MESITKIIRFSECISVCLISVFSLWHNAASQDIPTDGLSLWLRADSGIVKNSSNRISAWKDQSGSGNDAAQPKSAEKPLLIQKESWANNMPVVRFTNSSLNGSLGNTIKAPVTIFVVAYFNLLNQGTQHASYLIMIGNGCQSGNNASIARQTLKKGLDTENRYYSIYTCKAEDDLYGPKLEGKRYQVISAVHGTQVPRHHVYINGVKKEVMDDKSTLNIAGTYWIGRLKPYVFGGKEYAHFLDGDIAEILVYNAALSDAERKTVEGYLMQKYIAAPTKLLLARDPSPMLRSGRQSRQISLIFSGIAGTTAFDLQGRTITALQPEYGAYGKLIPSLRLVK